MRRVVAVLAVALLATQVAGAAALQGPVDATADGQPSNTHAVTESNSVSVDAAKAQNSTIRKTIDLHLTPSEPGTIDVVATYDVPDAVTALRATLPSGAENVESSSFTQTPDGYEWDGTTNPATLQFTLSVNQTASGSRAPSIQDSGEYSFVDTGEWALVTVPQLRTGWNYRGREGSVTITEEVTVDGEGSTGGEIAYLGPVDEHTLTANGQQFTLAVPEHASMVESPDDVLDALGTASNRLHVGARDDHVWFVAAPTSADWGVRGVEYGGNDAWVLADSRLDTAGNVWFHEYVHTRQAFNTAESGRWTMEAGAEYYAGLLALRTDYVSFDGFASYLSRGKRTPWRDAILSQPSTWTSGANYLKGSLVWGAIDRRVRLATNGTSTMSEVLYQLNQHDERVTNADVLAAVLDVSSPAVEERANRYTNTRESPEMWTRSQHVAAFSTKPARMEFDVREYRISGPFRNETFAEPPTLYVGETVTVVGSVANDGGRAGEYVATVEFQGDVLVEARGDLAAGEITDVKLTEQVGAAGTYNVTGGRNTVALDVRAPATVTVSDLTVDESQVRSGSSVTATVTLSNPGNVPATGPVDVTLDGEHVATVDAALAPGETASRTVNVTLPEAGQYELAAGDATVSVSAGGIGVGIPGFGIPAALVALLVAALLSRRRG